MLKKIPNYERILFKITNARDKKYVHNERNLGDGDLGARRTLFRKAGIEDAVRNVARLLLLYSLT